MPDPEDQPTYVVVFFDPPPPPVPITHLPRPEPMAMLLTRCEQAWVDDVRAGRRHVHLRERA